MAGRKKAQTELFPGRVMNEVSLADFKETVKRKKPKQHEKKFMDDLMGVAFSMDLPCIHIKQFCGNTFVPTCTGTKFHTHAPAPAVCPVCRQTVKAVCLKRTNAHLAGHWDILGISWAIETKHKISIGPQVAVLDPGQQFKGLLYKLTDIPAIAVNESQNMEAYSFLRDLSNAKHSAPGSISTFTLEEIETVLTEISKDIGGDCGLTEPDVPYIIEQLKEKKKK